jgi:hypothetical protein
MKDHTLICKFMGLCPSEKALTWWIKTRWKPKGDVDLKPRSKGFFTTVFNNVKDCKRVLKNNPYFFNSAGLYLILWTKNSILAKEDFIVVPVWIHLYSLPQEY